MTASPELRDATLTHADDVVTFTMQRDEVRNELTGTHLADDLSATVEWVNRSPDVSALIITGGGKAFSAGGNVKHMLAREGSFSGDVYEVHDHYRRGIQRIPLVMSRLEVPAIAAINGAAIGAGFDLACMCDMRLASRTATMGETFVSVGLIPGDGGGWFLQRLVGYQRAAELTFTGRVMSADEALRLGIVLEITEPEALMAQTLKLAQRIAAQPPQALRMAKRLMQSAQRSELRDHLDHCAVLQGICHNTQDHLEAVGAMLDKRRPSFKGR